MRAKASIQSIVLVALAVLWIASVDAGAQVAQSAAPGANPQGKTWTSGATCPPSDAPSGGAGGLYSCADTSGQLYVWTGSTWQAAGGGAGVPTSATVLTSDDETGTLTNSRQLVNGTNTTVNTSVSGQIAIDAANQVIVSVAQNGLVKDWNPPGFDPDVTTHLFVDPSAQNWQADTEVTNAGTGAGQAFVGAVVHRVGDATVRFKASENGSAVTASVEPTWSTDGTTPVNDGTVSRPLVWTPEALWGGPWQASTNFPSGTVIAGGGFGWQSDGGSGGNTGGTEPSWPAAPRLFTTTVSDGAITWSYIGPFAVWSPGTRYTFRPDVPPPTPGSIYLQITVRPTAAVAGVDYVFLGQPTGLWGTTGHTEPDWGAALPGDGSAWIDGEILWVEDTNTPTDQKLVITGIVAPTEPRVLTVINSVNPSAIGTGVILEDMEQVVGDYGTQAESTAGNTINAAESNSTLGSTNFKPMAYANGQWQPVILP